MRGFVDRREIDLQDVELDRVRWDQRREVSVATLANKKTLYVELVEKDLREIGAAVFAEFQRCAKDPDFFSDEMMEDVPRPKSADQFVEKPLSLKRYLRPGAFWRDVTIQSIVGRMNPWKMGEPRYWIEELKDVLVEPPYTILVFAARMVVTKVSAT